MSRRPALERTVRSEPVSATERAARDILLALERHELVAGQRLIETELALKLGVGRNAVREAIQGLAAKGIVDLSRHRSPSIRRLDAVEAMEVLEVAEAMLVLLARVAARNFARARHETKLVRVLQGLAEDELRHDRVGFAAMRREFYRTLLEIGDNRELHRHFASLQMQIIYVQFESPQLADARVTDYQAIGHAVMASDVCTAEFQARRHVERVRKIVQATQRTAVASD